MSAKPAPAVERDLVWESLQRAPVNPNALSAVELAELDAQMARPGTETSHEEVEHIVAERAKHER